MKTINNVGRKPNGGIGSLPDDGEPNPGLEQAIAMAGDMAKLSRRLAVAPGTIVHSRRTKNVSGDLVLAIWQTMHVKLSLLLKKRVSCPHCKKAI